MGILEILFFLFSVFSTVFAGNENACPSSFCGSFSLDYPFKLQTLQPSNDCIYINLSCNDTLSNVGTPILNLPRAGEFYVRFIGYFESYIELYDPGNCLMRRLINLNLSCSPFKAISYQSYTFYTCPSNSHIVGSYVLPIDCLSNSTNSTVATALISSDFMLKSGCKIIGRWQLPVLGLNQFEFDGINGDLYLKWDSISCKSCEDSDDTGGSKDNLWTRFAGSPFFIPSFVTLVTFLVICFLQIIKMIAGRYEIPLDSPTADVQPESTTTTTAPPRSTAGGLDESKISSCTELVVISESRINFGDNCNTCSICLESYVAQDTVRSIAKCEHCFHAECIELWLRKNRTCPVCRTVLADVVDL